MKPTIQHRRRKGAKEEISSKRELEEKELNLIKPLLTKAVNQR